MSRLRLPDLTVKRLGPDDGGILQSLLNLFRPKERPGFERIEMLLAQPDHLYFAALLRHQPVGWAIGYVLSRFQRDECFLYEIDVAPMARRQGIATAIVSAMQDWAINRGISEIFVVTEVNNESAQGLYAGSGAHPAHLNSMVYRWDLRK